MMEFHLQNQVLLFQPLTIANLTLLEMTDASNRTICSIRVNEHCQGNSAKR